VELDAPAVVSVAPSCSPASLVFALLFVAPNSICPSHDPARPPAIPANRGLRCRNEGCMAGAGWAVGAELAGVGCGAVAGFGVADC
jgi:hypothetical protein